MESEPSFPVAAPGEATTAEPGEYQSLDRRVIWLWRITGAIGWGIVLVFLLIGAGGIGGVVLHRFGLALGLWALAAALIGLWLLWYPPRRYRAWGYRLDGRVLETRSGIWFRVLKLLPLSRVQHVDLHRGPLERACGLASLLLHTAGTHEATIVIPGLEAAEAVRLRDHLINVGGDDAV